MAGESAVALEFVGPWFAKLAMQVELGRISPLTFNKYEGDWRRHLKPAFGRLPLAAIDQERLVRYMRTKIASGLSESSVKSSLIPLCGMLTDAVSDGHIQANPLRSPKRARHRGASRHDVLDLQVKRQPPKHLVERHGPGRRGRTAGQDLLAQLEQPALELDEVCLAPTARQRGWRQAAARQRAQAAVDAADTREDRRRARAEAAVLRLAGLADGALD